MSKQIKISVRNLVEFVMRHGSIDNTKTGSIKPIEGTRAHQMIQGSYNENYEAEYYLKYEFKYKDINIKIEGRADGILKDNDITVIDEIKTTLKDVYQYNENINPLHIAQAKCYGYIYCILNNLDNIDIQLTYYNIETTQINKVRKNYRLSELEKDFFYLIDEYKVWLDLEENHIIKRNESIDNLEFPFENYRKGQREFAVYVYKSIVEAKKCFAQAPTGTGKTISTLFPAIKAMGKNHTSKIFYLTAKTITREVCENSILLMKNNNLHLKYVTLSAKDKVCKKDKTNCNPEYCEYAKGYFDRVNNALKEILIKENNYSRVNIDILSEKYKLCPFELSLDLTMFSDVIICDYNYVFDPKVYLKRFFDIKKSDYTFLIDEAHNLVDRSRDMYSKTLSKSQFDSISKILKGKSRKLNYHINKIKSYLKEIDEELLLYRDINLVNHMENKSFDIDFASLLKNLTQKIDEYLEDSKDENEEIMNLYFDIHSFLGVGEYYDDNFVTIYEKNGNDIQLRIYCIDPSNIIGERMKKAKSTVIFSATLMPIDYFKSMYKSNEDDYFVSLYSPFDTNKRELIFANNINTTYNRRYETCEEIVEYIKACVDSKFGNYMVFFPSYSYMNLVYEMLSSKYEHIKVQVQTKDMSEESKEIFLSRFNEENETTHVGFCVLGSHFSEGVDLTNDKLIGVIVIGVGMPQIGVDRDIVKKHFDSKSHNGFDYAYTYPGMIKVLQAAGRCIRTNKDKGIIMLIDSRYSQGRYKRLFPKEWYPNKIARKREDISVICKKFWENMKEI
jgi:DNA excision repair protein ERCC-2